MFLFSISLTKKLINLFITAAYKSIYCFRIIILIGNIALYMLNTIYRAL